MEECVFCKIIDKQISSDVLYEDEEMIAFQDIKPKAPVHLLVVPKKHIATMNDITEDDIPLMGKMINRAKIMAVEHGIGDSGYKLIFNCGPEGGQAIYHIHLHILGGKPLRE